jgi:long-subunit fatty acid transport protein
MGGAFRAIASDWTAAYYNPAGYAFTLDNQVGAALSMTHNRHELTPDYWFRDASANEYANGMLNDQLLYNYHDVLATPSAGLMVRTPLWGETVFGFAAYQTFDHQAKWLLFDIDNANFRSYNDSVVSNDSMSGVLGRPYLHHQYQSDLNVVAFQVTAAREFKPEKLSLGLGLQLLSAAVIHKEVILRENPFTDNTDFPAVYDRPRTHLPQMNDNDGDGWGVGINAGMLWKPNERLNVAATFRAASNITIKGETNSELITPKNGALRNQVDPNSAEFFYLSGRVVRFDGDMETTLKLPPSISAGVAYQVSERFLVALDAELTFWSTYKGFDFTYSNMRSSVGGAQNAGADTLLGLLGDDISRPVTWDNAGKIMLGASFDAYSWLTLLAGGSADQSPIRSSGEQSPLYIDTGDKYGVNLGALVHIQRWDLGIATSWVDYPELKTTVDDTNGDGIDDVYPGTYRGEFFETVLSFNYRF